MAIEIPIARNFQGALNVLYQNTWYSHLRAILDTIVPVHPVGHPIYADIERPAWGVSVLCPWFGVGSAATCGITSGQDIAIEWMSWNLFDPTGVPASGPVIWFTPPASYNPFLTSVVLWDPWIRPTINFGSSNTLGISGRNNIGFCPYVGAQVPSTRDPGNYSDLNQMTFDPALILPATMFFCVQDPGNLASILLVNFRYRELGRAS